VTDAPRTRWELAGGAAATGYAARFGDLIDHGADIDGEARLADALVERTATILDAGAGIGRVGAALATRGHQVLAAEKDPALVAESRARYPDLPVIRADILDLTPTRLAGEGHRTGYDLIVLVGNVIVLLAPQTERRVLATLRELLTPAGRILVGFHPANGPGHARAYPFEEFAADVAASGLRVQHRFGTYQLGGPSDDYVVAVLTRA